jgi:hypothetical protein
MGYGDYNIDLPDGENFAPDESRVQELLAHMPKEPFHLGEPYHNRDAWEKVRTSQAGKTILEAAEDFASDDPIPYLTNELYVKTNESQDRREVDQIIPRFRPRLNMWTLAECIEPNGKYLPLIEKTIEALFELKAWNFPMHPDGMLFYEGSAEWVDLAVTHYTANLVTTLHLLDDRLRPDLRDQILPQIERRVFQPFEKRIKSGKDVWWWVTCEHNWNSVCHSEILSAALRVKPDPYERAWYAAPAEKLLPYAEEGFAPSGFYTEGVGYWGYGFSHHILAGELLSGVTNGFVDILKKPICEKISHFGSRMEIQKGIYPSFSDCDRTVQPPDWLKFWYNNRIDPERTHRDTSTPSEPFDPKNYNFGPMLSMILFHQVDINQAYAIEYGSTVREWFPDDEVQFLISRPREDSVTGMAATFKGGNNGVNHSHNDLGTFTVLVGELELLCDPGKETYNKRTFSKYRYQCDLLNSFGHPVPVAAGQLQRPAHDEHNSREGRKYHATIVNAAFKDSLDEVTLDLKKAYTVDTMEKLHRTFQFHRGISEKVVVIDEVLFSKPESFEVALITYDEWDLHDDGTLDVSNAGKAVQVAVHSDAGDFEFQHTVIQESATPTRLSWKLKEPVTSAKIITTVVPV